MPGRWIGMIVGALILEGGAIARADEVGCCDVECHSSDGAGRTLHSVLRRDLTQAECDRGFPDCETTWSPGACDANQERGLRMYRDDGAE